jgi:hypothetical protein
VDEDTEQACWHALEQEQRAQFEAEQMLLREDRDYELWLEKPENKHVADCKK